MSDHIEVYMAVTHEVWKITFDETYTGEEFMIVDTVDGVTPTTEDHLFNLVTDLR